MKNYLRIIFAAVVFLFCVFYIWPVFAFTPECVDSKDCSSGNCVAGKCYDNSIGSPCMSNDVCSSKNCYAGRCCPELYPMGGSCPKKSMAQTPSVGGSATNTVVQEPLAEENLEDEDSGAVFSDLSGQVEIRPDIDKRGWHSLKPGEAIPFGTHISTGANSSVVIILPDGVTFLLKPNTEIMINKPSEKKSHSQILYGSMKVIVEKKIQDESLEIDMDQAVIEISGTTLILEEVEGKSILKVIEGTVFFVSKATSKTEMISSGETITADKNGIGQKTTFDVAAENTSWDALKTGAEKSGISANTNLNSSASNLIYYIGAFIVFLVIVVIIVFLRRKKL